jgi:FMN phosphatase YigB (HAD superfamily)
MSVRRVVLLDLDGVILDNDRYDAEWERLAPLAFADRLGGNPNAWAAAQGAAWRKVEPETRARFDALPADARPSVAECWDEMNAAWVEEACALVGVDAPVSRRERSAAAERAVGAYFTNTRAAFPGAAGAIRALADGFELHMASGNPTIIVEATLRGLGVRASVGRAYGSDLAGAWKPGREFYAAILAGIRARGEDAIAVDDDDRALAAARALGVRTVKIGAASPAADLALASLADLPGAIDRLA